MTTTAIPSTEDNFFDCCLTVATSKGEGSTNAFFFFACGVKFFNFGEPCVRACVFSALSVCMHVVCMVRTLPLTPPPTSACQAVRRGGGWRWALLAAFQRGLSSAGRLAVLNAALQAALGEPALPRPVPSLLQSSVGQPQSYYCWRADYCEPCSQCIRSTTLCHAK